MGDTNTKIKICGLRTPEDIEIVNRYLPDYAGFICCSRFWRYVDKETLRSLSLHVAPGIKKVGVFVDDPVETVSSYIDEGLVDLVQLHGHEDDDYIEALRSSIAMQKKQEQSPDSANSACIIKAFQIHSEDDIRAAASSRADLVLLDSGQGSGRTLDWRLIRDIGRPFFLAGGLDPDNLREAIDRFHPYAVDISSGVETDRHKDENKVRLAVETVRKQ